MEVRLREYGSESVEVVDNGPGIAPHNYQVRHMMHDAVYDT